MSVLSDQIIMEAMEDLDIEEMSDETVADCIDAMDGYSDSDLFYESESLDDEDMEDDYDDNELIDDAMDDDEDDDDEDDDDYGDGGEDDD